MDQNKNLKLKIALLSTCFISASLNAVTSMAPEMAKAFPQVNLSTIELITTIPSLFQMVGVLTGKNLSGKIGHKYTMLAGLLLCSICGVLPAVLPLFPVILVTRCLLGLGAGFLTSSLLTLIIHFFDGQTRSTMIGLNGGISGVGSALTAFIAGQLFIFGWNVTFAVYGIGFIIAVLFFVGVPNVKMENSQNISSEKAEKVKLPLGLWSLAALMFVSVLMATFYVIKASILITDNGFGTAADGSLAITFLSLGSFTAGVTYGWIRQKLGAMSLAFFYITCLAGNLIGWAANNCALVWVGAFLLGYGYLGFVPFIQDEVSRKYRKLGQNATNMVLVFQSLGAFFTPYICPIFGIVSDDLKIQFLMVAIIYAVLIALSIIMAMRNKNKETT